MGHPSASNRMKSLPRVELADNRSPFDEVSSRSTAARRTPSPSSLQEGGADRLIRYASAHAEIAKARTAAAQSVRAIPPPVATNFQNRWESPHEPLTFAKAPARHQSLDDTIVVSQPFPARWLRLVWPLPDAGERDFPATGADIVMALSLLYHLDDGEVNGLFREARRIFGAGWPHLYARLCYGCRSHLLKDAQCLQSAP